MHLDSLCDLVHDQCLQIFIGDLKNLCREKILYMSTIKFIIYSKHLWSYLFLNYLTYLTLKE